MNIFVYSDESGVFDKVHNDYFVFGGIICLGKSEKDDWTRKYAHVENTIRESLNLPKEKELKACFLDNKHKNSIYRSLNSCYKFGGVVLQKEILDTIFKSKKDKQRYLDYVYKISVKNAFLQMMGKNIFKPKDVENIYFYVDEHTTATNGRYELREGLEQEFKYGTYNYNYHYHFPPIFPDMKNVFLEFRNSDSTRLVRAADIVANHLYYIATKKKRNFKEEIEQRNTFIKMFP